MHDVCRILLVDDHKLLMEGIRSLLAPHSHLRVAGMAPDGKEAVGLAATLSPDLVIMDISMPGMNGVEASRAILQIRPETRILIYTGHEDQRHLLELIQLGIMGHVCKSDPPSVLLQAIDAVRQGEVFLSCRTPVFIHSSHPSPSPPFHSLLLSFPHPTSHPHSFSSYIIKPPYSCPSHPYILIFSPPPPPSPPSPISPPPTHSSSPQFSHSTLPTPSPYSPLNLLHTLPLQKLPYHTPLPTNITPNLPTIFLSFTLVYTSPHLFHPSHPPTTIYFLITLSNSQSPHPIPHFPP